MGESEMEVGRQNLTSRRVPFTYGKSPSSGAAANGRYMASLNWISLVGKPP